MCCSDDLILMLDVIIKYSCSDLYLLESSQKYFNLMLRLIATRCVTAYKVLILIENCIVHFYADEKKGRLCKLDSNYDLFKSNVSSYFLMFKCIKNEKKKAFSSIDL